MKTLYKIILISMFALASLAGQVSVSHAEEIDYKLLAPLPLTNSPTGPVTPNISPSTYISGVVKLAISLAGVIAVLMIVIAGFKYVTVENTFGKSTARQDINNALIGLFLAIAAYTILNLINPTLTNFSLAIEPVKDYKGLEQEGYCAGKTETRDGKTVCVEPIVGDETCRGTMEGNNCVTEPRNTTNNSGEYTGNKDSNCYQEAWTPTSPCLGGANVYLKDQDVRTDFEKAGIPINRENCPYVGSSGCTSLMGISPAVKNGLLSINEDCRKFNGGKQCNIVITGGTEYWLHGSRTTDIYNSGTNHTIAGFPGIGGSTKNSGHVVDLRHNAVSGDADSDFTKFIRTQGKEIKPGNSEYDACVASPNFYWKYRYNGGLYVFEKIGGNDPHLHVCFD